MSPSRFRWRSWCCGCRRCCGEPSRQPRKSKPFRLGNEINIDCLNLSGQRGQDSLNFTRREIDILQYLNSNSHRPIAREELLDKVWCYKNHQDIETRTVDIHIAKLRRKIECDPAEPQFLITVRGAGYRLLGVKT